MFTRLYSQIALCTILLLAVVYYTLLYSFHSLGIEFWTNNFRNFLSNFHTHNLLFYMPHPISYLIICYTQTPSSTYPFPDVLLVKIRSYVSHKRCRNTFSKYYPKLFQLSQSSNNIHNLLYSNFNTNCVPTIDKLSMQLCCLYSQ